MNINTLPTFSVYIIELLGNLVFMDTWFYLLHRLLHTKILYKFHQHHHSYRPTITLSYVAMTLPEFIMENLGYVVLPPILSYKVLGRKMYMSSWLSANLILLIWASLFHSNELKNISTGRYNINGPSDHALHHYYGEKNYNFSLLFTHWDRLFGTYRIK